MKYFAVGVLLGATQNIEALELRDGYVCEDAVYNQELMGDVTEIGITYPDSDIYWLSFEEAKEKLTQLYEDSD